MGRYRAGNPQRPPGVYIKRRATHGGVPPGGGNNPGRYRAGPVLIPRRNRQPEIELLVLRCVPVQSTTLVIIPAYNEAATIGQVIKNIKRWCDADILVVNDGSTDGTSATARAEKVTVIDLPCNLGIGGAMQTGYRYACRYGYEFAVQVDADGQHDPRFIDTLVQPLLAGKADMVIGSRYMEDGDYRGSLARRAGSRFFSFLLKLLTGQAIYDTTSGFRAVNRRVLAYFIRHYPPDYPEVEVIMQLLRQGYRLKEIPVAMYPRKGGHSSITLLRSVYYMLKVSLAVVISYLR